MAAEAAAAAASAVESASSSVQTAVPLGLILMGSMGLVLLALTSMLLWCNLTRAKPNPAPIDRFVRMQDQNHITVANGTDVTQSSEAQASKLESSETL